MILTIAKFESRRLLFSAQTYLIAAMLSLLFGFLFLKQLEVFLGIQNQLATVHSDMPSLRHAKL